MKPVVPKLQRCAIYTRKSTEHNLDLEFNSLDAQREACEAYIKSQAHEGWRLVPDRYDDGGFSGGSLDRPALQTPAGRRRGRQDRHHRGLQGRPADPLAGRLRQAGRAVRPAMASRSSRSPSRSTPRTSMGRLTLNVLLSFAQFEREVIGERVRDKIAASKRKGIWVGGPVPLVFPKRCCKESLWQLEQSVACRPPRSRR